MKKYFVVSDVHSFYSEMMKALEKKQFDINNKDHILCVAGDAFDRGNQSKEILQFMNFLGDRLIYVRGNHEDLLFDCVRDIVSGKTIGSHHFSNGTVKTIEQLCGLKENELWFPRRSDSLNHTVYEKMKPVLEWINTKTVDFAVIDDFVIVHGWIPTTGDSIDFLGKWKNPKAVPMEEWEDCGIELWKQARWSNGMELWKNGVRIPDKTIICGHFHSSWGHSHIHQDRKEFPDKNREDWQKSFIPFVDDGIIAIDSCCAYSGFLNCITLEIEDEE